MSSPSAPTDQAGRIRAIVGAHIEPITRFSADDLHEAEAEKAFAVPLTLTLDQAVSFSKELRTGPGSLPGGVANLGDETKLDAELDARLALATQEAPQAVEAWAKTSAGSYRRLMPATAAFLRAPGAAGFEHRCGTCIGAKQIACTACGGKGKKDCTHCTASGRVDCPSCDGRKYKPCTAYPCSGRGTWTEYETRSVWSEAEGRYNSETVSVQHSCPTCSTTGRVTCYDCGPDAKVRCPECSGNGHLDCTVCSRTGKIDCSACRASGIQHVRGSIAAAVQHAERAEIGTDNATLHQLITTRLPREAMPGFGGLDRVTIQTQGLRLRTTHQLHIDVREAHLQAGTERFVLHGFGPDAQVFDFRNIAGQLLEEDLHKLEQALAAGSRWRPARGSGLLDTTADFLRSELNMLIAEHLATHESPDAAAAAVQTHFGGLVDTAYIARTHQALSTAITRLYGAELLGPAFWLCALGALLCVLSFILGWPAYDVRPMLLATLAGGALAWLILEWRTRRRIVRQFAGEYGQRIIAQLKIRGSVRRWRKGIAIALPVTLLLAIAATAMLPPVQALRQGYRNLQQSDELLQNWLSFGVAADLQLRHYPAHTELLRKARQGDQQAIVVLGWEYLLGANGTPKNVAEAGRWLDKAKPEITQSRYWKTAKAVQTLNEEAMPDALRSAARELAEASEQDLPEAAYWLARLLLAPQSPLHDARQGMHYLTRAADQGHAHAALLAAQKYARGEDVKRNASLAHRYATIAANAGLPEANALVKP